MKNFLNKLLIPFAIIHIRIIQYRYKRITLRNIYHNQNNRNIATLTLLQAKERYYQMQFNSWGKFHPQFSYEDVKWHKHVRFLRWLFPEKDFKEFPIVLCHSYDAIIYYQNKIYELSNGKPPLYDIEIPKQIKKWERD